MDLAAARAVVAGLLLLLWVAATRREKLRVRVGDAPFLVVFGVVGLALLHYTYFKAIASAGVATAILLEYLAPVIVLVVSVVFLGDRPTWRLPVGVLLAVGGCALVVGVGGERGLDVSAEGIWWGLAAAVTFSAYMIMGKVAGDRFSSWTLLTWGLLVAGAFWSVVVGPSRILAVLAEPQGLLAVSYVAVFSTIVPFGLFLAALREIDATSAGVTSTVEPVLAGVGAYFLFGEGFDLLQMTGAALVIAAIILAQMPSRRQPLPPGS
jgi:drug/metabolite transporter (DMT)-like permease